MSSQHNSHFINSYNVTPYDSLENAASFGFNVAMFPGEICRFGLFPFGVKQITFAPDGYQFLVLPRFPAERIFWYDLRLLDYVLDISLPKPALIYDAQFTADSARFWAFLSGPYRIVCWDAKEEKGLSSFELAYSVERFGGIHSACFFDDNRFVLTISSEGWAHVFRTSDGQEETHYPLEFGEDKWLLTSDLTNPPMFHFDRASKRLAIYAQPGHVFQVRDMLSGDMWVDLSDQPLIREETHPVKIIYFSGTEFYIDSVRIEEDPYASVQEGKGKKSEENFRRMHDVLRLDLNDMKPSTRLKGHIDFLHSATYSPDRRYLVTGAWDRTLRVWDVAKEEQVAIYNGGAGELEPCVVAFSPKTGLAVVGYQYDLISSHFGDGKKTPISLWSLLPPQGG